MAILFLFIFMSTPPIFQLSGFYVVNIPYFLHFLLFYLSPAIVWLATLGFFIYMLLAKDDMKYWSIFFLAITTNLGLILLFDIPKRIVAYLDWKNSKDSDMGFLYNITTARIFGWIFTLIIVIGFICLYFYFRSKYKSKVLLKTGLNHH